MNEVDIVALRRLNQQFYEAFEAQNFDVMSDLWHHSDRVTCTHPGWTVLRGWGAIAASWVALFQGPQHIQFILTDEHVEIVGDVAWVTVDENIIGSETGATVSALNIFERIDGLWRVVAHHGAPVANRQ